MSGMKRLLIMAAGTGGHIFPGLAIADTMKARGWDVSWLGTARGMECELVPKHGVAMDTIDFSGMRGKGLMHTLRGAFRLAAEFYAIASAYSDGASRTWCSAWAATCRCRAA